LNKKKDDGLEILGIVLFIIGIPVVFINPLEGVVLLVFGIFLSKKLRGSLSDLLRSI